MTHFFHIKFCPIWLFLLLALKQLGREYDFFNGFVIRRNKLPTSNKTIHKCDLEGYFQLIPREILGFYIMI